MTSSIYALTRLLAPRRNIRRSARVLLRRLADAGYEVRPLSAEVSEKDILEWACVQVFIADAVPVMSLTATLSARTGGEKAAGVAGQHRLVNAALAAAAAAYPRGVALVRSGDVEVVPAHVEAQFGVKSRCP